MNDDALNTIYGFKYNIYLGLLTLNVRCSRSPLLTLQTLQGLLSTFQIYVIRMRTPIEALD